ncbi:hypothetical protein J6590_042185 [Homalodisca vitripennis]|nr:hypothetical protein J6590_042185 [Homalodisca vitripennis]
MVTGKPWYCTGRPSIGADPLTFTRTLLFLNIPCNSITSGLGGRHLAGSAQRQGISAGAVYVHTSRTTSATDNHPSLSAGAAVFILHGPPQRQTSIPRSQQVQLCSYSTDHLSDRQASLALSRCSLCSYYTDHLSDRQASLALCRWSMCILHGPPQCQTSITRSLQTSITRSLQVVYVHTPRATSVSDKHHSLSAGAICVHTKRTTSAIDKHHSLSAVSDKHHSLSAGAICVHTKRTTSASDKHHSLSAGDFRTTTNGRANGLLARTGSLSGHPSKQQPRSALLDPVILL